MTRGKHSLHFQTQHSTEALAPHTFAGSTPTHEQHLNIHTFLCLYNKQPLALCEA